MAGVPNSMTNSNTRERYNARPLGHFLAACWRGTGLEDVGRPVGLEDVGRSVGTHNTHRKNERTNPRVQRVCVSARPK